MMPAGIGAPADLDAQLLDFRISVAINSRESTSASVSERVIPRLQGRCSRASGDVGNRSRPGCG